MRSEKIKSAISIHQPYVEQILQGKKKFEYRSKSTNIRGRVYIYAALKEAEDAEDYSYTLIGKDFASLPRGMIIGSVKIVDCKWAGKNIGYAYQLANPLRAPLKTSHFH